MCDALIGPCGFLQGFSGFVATWHGHPVVTSCAVINGEIQSLLYQEFSVIH